jgi:hypothetical protein
MRQQTRRGTAVLGVVFAATMMMVTGVFQALSGLEAIIRAGFFRVSSDYLFNLSIVAFGWIHLALGVLMVLCGLMLYSGARWAAVAGIVLAGLTIVDQFLFLPFYPIWSVLTIAIGGFVIWSLAVMLQSMATYGEDAWLGVAPAGGRAGRHEAADVSGAPAAPATPTEPARPAAPTGTVRPAAPAETVRPESAPESTVPPAGTAGLA